MTSIITLCDTSSPLPSDLGLCQIIDRESNLVIGTRVSNLQDCSYFFFLFDQSYSCLISSILANYQYCPLLSMSVRECERSVRTWTLPRSPVAQECIFIWRASCWPAYQSMSQDPSQTFHGRGRSDPNLLLFSDKVPSFITLCTGRSPRRGPIQCSTFLVFPRSSPGLSLNDVCIQRYLGKHPPIAVAGIFDS